MKDVGGDPNNACSYKIFRVKTHKFARVSKPMPKGQHDWKTFSLKALENDFETDFYRTEMSYKSMKRTYMGLNLSYIGLNIVK